MKVLVVIMSKYRDRGIIKWAPFDALISYQEVLKVMRYERGKQQKPMLSDDQYETLNRTISASMSQNKAVYVVYYEDGYFKTLYGYVKTYDNIKKTLIFVEGFHLDILQIIDANN